MNRTAPTTVSTSSRDALELAAGRPGDAGRSASTPAAGRTAAAPA